MTIFKITSLFASVAFACSLGAVPPTYEEDPFRQLEELLPTANAARTASGAPGANYWQQRADYDIAVSLDDKKQRIRGEGTVTYHNHSPDRLEYLWVQLDQNRFSKHSDYHAIQEAPKLNEGASFRQIEGILSVDESKHGYRIDAVADADGNELAHTIVGTMMRIELPEPLLPGGMTNFQVRWGYNIVDAKKIRARGGYEYFEEDKNYIYEIAQWFPRMAAYTDYAGWQHKQFLGRGEFTLEFGDYRVAITVPADHVVAATGVLQNPDEVLSDPQQERLTQAEDVEKPMFIITPEEAKANEKSRSKEEKTWVFEAKNVRDFAWASSRKFIWDAQQMKQQTGEPVWAMSYYPTEAEPLWSKYSTQAVVHTVEVFSKFTFDYPYPVAISVNGPAFGMEYPMICFNGPRPEEDGTYSKRTKHALIGVVIHEVGHNWFPMIVNSDERQWTWMDEGLNSFVQFLAEQEWQEKYEGRARPSKITGYMSGRGTVPIMTNSESIKQFGANAYGKPSAALNVLRESVMGRENFDFAFKTYSRRWMFKRPTPADFFRSMEDASGVDLDWFWRGWFYTTKHVDIGIGAVRMFQIDSRNPDIEKGKLKREREEYGEDRIDIENKKAHLPRRVDRFPQLLDFYNEFDELDVTAKEREEYVKMLEDLSKEEKQLLKLRDYFYVVEFENVGGLVMPIVVEVKYDDGSKEMVRVPAEIWRQNSKSVSKLIVAKRKIAELRIDPLRELADADALNDRWPERAIEGRIRLKQDDAKRGGGDGSNPMREAREAKAKGKKTKDAPKIEKAEEDVKGKKKK
ncbi:MAG: hypothetical protein ACI9NC_004496 [Verrucomicrobiales bacterium]|jgi:hypothetical protein